MQNPRYTLKQKGKFLNVSGDEVSKNYQRLIIKLNLNKSLKEKIKKIKNDIYN